MTNFINKIEELESQNIELTKEISRWRARYTVVDKKKTTWKSRALEAEKNLTTESTKLLLLSKKYKLICEGFKQG